MGLGKDKKGNGYNYVSGIKVIDAIKPLMNELGLLLKPEVITIENQRIDYLVSISQDKETKVWSGKPKSETLSKAMMAFTWIDVETGDKEVCSWGANGQNDWDKGVGSAMTYAERYFLLKFFHIATDEDDIDDQKIGEIIIDIEACTEGEKLQEIWNKNVPLQADAKFKQAVTNQINKLIDEIIIDIEACTEEAQLQEIWNNNVSFQTDAKFKQAVTNQKKKLNEQK